MIWLFMVLYPASASASASWRSPASNPTRAFMNPVDLAPPQVTPGPEIDSKGIFARANIATCGYVSGNAGEKSKNSHVLLTCPPYLTRSASPLTCPDSYMCSSTARGWACCDQIQCQGNYKTCEDYGGAKKIWTSMLSW